MKEDKTKRNAKLITKKILWYSDSGKKSTVVGAIVTHTIIPRLCSFKKNN